MGQHQQQPEVSSNSFQAKLQKQKFLLRPLTSLPTHQQQHPNKHQHQHQHQHQLHFQRKNSFIRKKINHTIDNINNDTNIHNTSTTTTSTTKSSESTIAIDSGDTTVNPKRYL